MIKEVCYSEALRLITMLRPKYVHHRTHMKAKILRKMPLQDYNGTVMNPSDNQQPAGTFKNPLQVMSPGETVVCEMKRHPIGLIGVYFGSAFVIVLAVAVAVAAPSFISDLSSQVKALLYFGALFVTIFALIFTYI